MDVVVLENVWGEAFEQLAADYRVVRDGKAGSDPDCLSVLLDGVRGLVVRNRTTVDADLLSRVPSLQIVARAGVGLDNIDVAAADEAGIVVTAPLGANAISVSEHTFALALALVRELPAHDAAVRSGQWQRRPGRELAGRCWGLLGAGATGRSVARLAGAFGMRVVGYDPYVSESDAANAGIEMAGFAEVLDRADVLSVHLPSTPDTQGVLDAAVFAAMRTDAVIVSVGRGEVIDETALADALTDGRIAGAGLDVRANEPPQRGPLDAAPNVIFTPHVAGITVESQQRINEILTADLAAVLGGGSAAHAVGACSTVTSTGTSGRGR